MLNLSRGRACGLVSAGLFSVSIGLITPATAQTVTEPWPATSPGCGEAQVDGAIDLAVAEIGDVASYDVISFSCMYDSVRLDFGPETDPDRGAGKGNRPPADTRSFRVNPGGPALPIVEEPRTDVSEEEANARAVATGTVSQEVSTKPGRAPSGGLTTQGGFLVSEYVAGTDDMLVYGQKTTSGQTIWSSAVNMRTRLRLSGYTSQGFRIGWNETEGRYVQFLWYAEVRKVNNNWADEVLHGINGGSFQYLTYHSPPDYKGVQIGTSPAGKSFYVEVIEMKIRDQASGGLFYPLEDISTLRFSCNTTMCYF